MIVRPLRQRVPGRPGDSEPHCGIESLGIESLGVEAPAVETRAVERGSFEHSAERYSRVVEQNLNAAYRVARRCGVSPAHLDDVLQDAFLIVATKLAQVAPESQRTFVVSVTIRVAANWRRGQRRKPEDAVAHIDELAGNVPTPEHEAHRLEGLQLLDAVLAQMTAEQREVFILAELEQCTCSEIARQLKVKEAAIVSRLRRARATFDAFCHAFQSGEAPSPLLEGRMTHG